MPIVFDQVDGVIQRAPEAGADEPSAEAGATPLDSRALARELKRQERRQQRLKAD